MESAASIGPGAQVHAAPLLKEQRNDPPMMKLFAAPPQPTPGKPKYASKDDSDDGEDGYSDDDVSFVEAAASSPARSDTPQSEQRRDVAGMSNAGSGWSICDSDGSASSDSEESSEDTPSISDAQIQGYGALRALAYRIVHNPICEWVVCGLIIANCITLALERPHVESPTLNGFECFFTVCFAVEMVLKIFAKGVYFHQGAYFKSKGNCFDFIIVVTNFIGLFILDANVSSARAIRVMKIILMLDKFPRLKRVVRATIMSLQSLMHIWMILLFIITVHSIWALQLWQGTWSYRCVLPETGETNGHFCRQNASLSSNILSAGEECHDERFECTDYGTPYWDRASFDDFPSAFLIVMQCATINSWSSYMYATFSTNGLFPLLFFTTLVTVSNYLVLPYCVVVMKDSVGGSKQQRSARNRVVESIRNGLRMHATLKRFQVRWYEAAFMTHGMVHLLEASQKQEQVDVDSKALLEGVQGDKRECVIQEGSKIEKTATAPPMALLRAVILLNRVIPVILVVHVIFLSLRHQGMPSALMSVIDMANCVAVACYVCEIGVKLLTYRLSYFEDNYNVIDLVAVVVAVEETLYKLITMKACVVGVVALRLVRIVRVYKVFKGSSYMIRQAEAVQGVAQNWNFVMVMALYWLTATLVLMQTCGEHMVPPEQNAFIDFPSAALSTLQIITGDAWEGMMYSAMEGTNVWPVCALFQFIHVFGYVLFVHLFLAVVIDHFEIVHDATAICREGRNKNKTALKRQRRKLEEAKALYACRPDSPQRTGSPRGRFDWLKAGSFVTHQRLAVPEEYRHTPALCEAYMKGVTGDVLADDLIDYEMKNHKRGKQLGNAHARGHEARREAGAENIHCLLGWSASLAALQATKHRELLTDDQHAFGCIPPWARARAMYIVKRKWFDRLFTVLAILAAVLAFVEDTGDHEILCQLDYCLTGLFFVEAILKSVAHCFLFARDAYLKNNWNVFELVILILVCVSYATETSKISVLRIFRSLRSFRALRMIRRFEVLRRVVVGLLRCIPGLVTIFTLALVLFLLYALAGVELFGGTLSRCSVPYLHTEDECVGQWEVHTEGNPFSRVYPYLPPARLVVPLNTSDDVSGHDTWEEQFVDYYLNRTMHVEAKWVNSVQHFDHVPAAMRFLFQIATLDRWRDSLELTLENCDSLLYSSNETAVGGCRWKGLGHVYFLSFILVVNLFVLPIITAEVVVTFMRVMKELAHISDYSARELSYFYMMKLLLFIKPTNNGIPRTTKVAKFCDWLCNHPRFDAAVGLCIAANILVMGLEYHGMSDDYALALHVTDYIFTFLFLAEAIVKITALGFNYFRIGWNQFDFLLVVSSIVEIIVSVVAGLSTPLNPFLLRSLRAFLRLRRAQRLLRLVRRARGVRMIFETVWVSIGMLVANMVLYLSFLAMFALLGISLFGSVRKIRGLSNLANFDNFPNALLTLHRVSTGDAWSEILENCMITEPYCVEDHGDCGWPIIAPLYFFLFKSIAYLILTALFIATVSDNYSATKRLVALGEGMKEIQIFVDTWSQLFSSEEKIRTFQLQFLMAEIGRTSPSRHFPPEFSVPFNFRRIDVQSTLRRFYILDGQGEVHFSNVLLEIAYRKVRDALRGGRTVSRKEWWSFEEDWYALVPQLRLPVTRRLGYRYTARDYFAALHVQTWYRFLSKLSKMRKLLAIDVRLYQVNLAQRDGALSPVHRDEAYDLDEQIGTASASQLKQERRLLLHSAGAKPVKDVGTATDDLPGSAAYRTMSSGTSEWLRSDSQKSNGSARTQRLRAVTIRPGSTPQQPTNHTPLLTPLLQPLGGAGASGSGVAVAVAQADPVNVSPLPSSLQIPSRSQTQRLYQPPVRVSPQTPMIIGAGDSQRGSPGVKQPNQFVLDTKASAVNGTGGSALLASSLSSGNFSSLLPEAVRLRQRSQTTTSAPRSVSPPTISLASAARVRGVTVTTKGTGTPELVTLLQRTPHQSSLQSSLATGQAAGHPTTPASHAETTSTVTAVPGDPATTPVHSSMKGSDGLEASSPAMSTPRDFANTLAPKYSASTGRRFRALTTRKQHLPRGAVNGSVGTDADMTSPLQPLKSVVDGSMASLPSTGFGSPLISRVQLGQMCSPIVTSPLTLAQPTAPRVPGTRHTGHEQSEALLPRVPSLSPLLASQKTAPLHNPPQHPLLPTSMQ
eukprot:TRINITY_DN18296_c0_g1_i1.p1 TRINITY_DN18296_c0_g1~~TRINITY_DN18296_c0_g1_i1.p1  ORF type:complete len:2174 (+),score=374.20 TRINITY_DN18296_c0_g1_i1:174-6695(+)